MATQSENIQTVRETVTLPLNEIVVEENPVRKFPDSAAEVKSFAAEIEQNGLIQPLGVQQVNGNFVLRHGHRRHAALSELAKRQKNRSLPVLCTLVDGDDTFGISVQENLRQKTLTPMEFALLCRTTREKYGWQGEKGTMSTAKFLGVSKTQVTQHEKLLLLSKSDQKRVHNAALSASAGLELQDIPVEFRERILNRAAEIEKEQLEQKRRAAAARAEKAAKKKATAQKKLQAAKKGKKPAKVIKAAEAEAREAAAEVNAAKKTEKSAAKQVEEQKQDTKQRKVKARSIRQAASEAGAGSTSKRTRERSVQRQSSIASTTHTMKEWLQVVEILGAEHQPKRARTFADAFTNWYGMKISGKKFTEILRTEAFK